MTSKDAAGLRNIPRNVPDGRYASIERKLATGASRRKKVGTRTTRTPLSTLTAGESPRRDVSTVISCPGASSRAMPAMKTPPPPPSGGYSKLQNRILNGSDDHGVAEATIGWMN